MHIAHLASPVTMPGSPTRRGDAFEHDYMMRLLRSSFHERGGTIVDVSWDDEAADWSRYDAAVIGTAWDYWDRVDDFMDALARIERSTRLFNPLSLVRWNIHKSYLRDLEARGAEIIPTIWLDQPGENAANDAFDQLGADTLVFKRQVGAGADGQHRLKRGDAIPAMRHSMMAQPFLPMIETEGELSFVFVDGELSHSLLKRAAPGDYRIQSLYGGHEMAIDPAASDVRAAQAILETLDVVPLYARVDMLRSPAGSLMLMELELIEPYLYPEQGPRLGDLLADAVMRRL